MKKNQEIREKARQSGVYLYEIADTLGVSEPTFNARSARDFHRSAVRQIVRVEVFGY